MTADEIAAVRESFARLSPHADSVVEHFYQVLFGASPGLRALFPASLDSQRTKLFAALSLLVNHAARLDSIEPELRALGRRHRDIGVKDEDYSLVQQALVVTLSKELGDALTPTTTAAWSELLGKATELMRDQPH